MKKSNAARLCRLCACEEDFNSFINIFDENSDLELEMKITKLLPVVVMPWDPMPHTVCNKCIDKLNSFNEFYEDSLKAERFLRTLHPSAPENELENVHPVVQVLDHPILKQNSLKLPMKKRQGLSKYPHKSKKDIDCSEFVEIPPDLDKNEEEMFSKGRLNCFIVNQITNRDSIFTCRECCRTFTRKSSALTHSCVRIEDCGEVETIDLGEDSEKSLPPLKIRLFSMKSGLFICYLCQTAFKDKKELVEHIKEHFLDGKWEEKNAKRPKGKRKGRRIGSKEDEDWEEAYKKKAIKRKKRKPSGPQKRGKPKDGDDLGESQNGTCVKCGQDRNSSIPNTPEKETMESTTQYSEISENSEVEVEIKDEEAPVILTSSSVKNMVQTETKNENPDISFAEEKLESSDSSLQIMELPKITGNDSKSDEVTVLEVVNNKSSSTFSSCVFCDKIFATKDALIIHQNKHLQGYSVIKPEGQDKKAVLPPEEESFLCSICAMMFTNKKTLLEHEQYHLVDLDGVGCQKKIRIALGQEFSDRDAEQEYQISKGRGFITITVTAGEKKIPQIELV